MFSPEAAFPPPEKDEDPEVDGLEAKPWPDPSAVLLSRGGTRYSR